MDEKIYAVVTGDLIGSRKLKDSGVSYVDYLNKSLEYVGHDYQIPFFIYRGDSFQGVTADPSSALKDTIILRLQLDWEKLIIFQTKTIKLAKWMVKPLGIPVFN